MAESPTLRDVQHALAREYGAENWIAQTRALQLSGVVDGLGLGRFPVDEYERLVDDLVAAFNSRDEAALKRLNAGYQRSLTFDDLWGEFWRRVHSFQQRASRGGPQQLRRDKEDTLVAQDAGFGSWTQLHRAVSAGARRFRHLTSTLR